MKPIVNFIAVVLVVVILVSMLVGGYYGVQYLWDIYAILSLEIRVALLTGVVTILISAFLLFGGLRTAARLITNGRLAESRHDLYTQVLSLFDGVLASPATSLNLNSKLLIEEVSLLKPKMFLLAGTESLDVYLQIENILQNDNIDPDEIKHLVNKLISNFRGDLGYPKNYSESKEKFMIVDVNEEHAKNNHKASQKDQVNSF